MKASATTICWLIALVLIALLLGLQLRQVADRHRGWNRDLCLLALRLKPGCSQAETLRQAQQMLAPMPGSYWWEDGKDAYFFSTPLQWGAQNLTIYLTFEKAHLVHRRVRNADSENFRPAHTPADF